MDNEKRLDIKVNDMVLCYETWYAVNEVDTTDPDDTLCWCSDHDGAEREIMESDVDFIDREGVWINRS